MKRGVTAVELIVAVVILGVLAALAIPQFSRAADGSAEIELRARLSLLRTAIDMYYHDHRAYPGQRPDGTPTGGAGTAAALVSQLTRYTDAQGRVAPTRSEQFRFGPYLEHGPPACPVPPREDRVEIHLLFGNAAPGYVENALQAGWVYNVETGYIAANSDQRDSSGLRYDRY